MNDTFRQSRGPGQNALNSGLRRTDLIGDLPVCLLLLGGVTGY